MKWKDEYDKFITSLYGRYSYIKTYEESKVKQELFVKEIYDYLSNMNKEYFEGSLDLDDINILYSLTKIFEEDEYSNRLFSYSIFAYTVEIRNEEYINHENFMKYLEDKYELVSIKNKIERINEKNIQNT